MMKQKIFCLIFILINFSCTKQFDITPESTLTNAVMWKSETDIQGAVNGMFSQLRTALNRNLALWGDYRSGSIGNGLAPSVSYQDIFNNTLDRDEEGTDWANLYKTINDANLIIRYIEKIQFTNENTKSYLLGNAFFVRGLCYFYIARVWGDAPIVLTGFVSDNQDDLYPSRQTVDKVLVQAMADAEKSFDLLENSSSKARYLATSAASKMLLADISLWEFHRTNNSQLLSKARAAVDYVLQSGYELSSSYETIFRSKNSSEVIFGLSFRINEFVGGFAADYLLPVQNVQNAQIVNNPVLVGSNQQWTFFSSTFENFLNAVPADTRKAVCMGTYYDEQSKITFKWINKYPGQWQNGTRYFDSDIIFYRLAEAILFKAELEILSQHKTEAIDLINQVAARAYGTTNYYPYTLSPEDVKNILVDERMKEFALEGKTWFDLIRLGVVFDRVQKLAGRSSEKNVLFWPVNSNSINTNPNIQQTEGYN